VIAGMSDRVPLTETADYARRVEAMGFDVLHVPETVHDSMQVALLALMSTEHLRVQTSLTLAFPRSPMLLALQAWDLARFGGRFDLGLGSQIRQNIEGRFGVPWRDPIRWMSDYVETVRAIWRSFADGSPLDVRTEAYRLDRLQPFFVPEPIPAPPRIWLGGVRPRAVDLAARVADGYVTHPTNSHPEYLRRVVEPALANNGRSPIVDVAIPFATGRTDADVDASRLRQRGVLAFLLSTPAYSSTIELFGWDELGPELRRVIRSGDWSALATTIDDEQFDTLVPSGTWSELPGIIADWFGGLADGVLLQPPEDPDLDDEFAEIVESTRPIPGRNHRSAT